MKYRSIVLAIAAAAIGAATASETPPTLEYDVVAVKRKLVHETDDGERLLQAGDHARSGDLLFTASRSKAELAVPEAAARFAIGSKTRFRLAHGRPGVLLELERGSLRGIFDRLQDGDERERLVTTPSAVLAVRGTEYGVEVAKNGDTSVAVFDGIVEVRDSAGLGDPVRLLAGQLVRVRHGREAGQPQLHGLSSSDWDRGRRLRAEPPGGPGATPGMGGPENSPGAGGPPSSSQGGSKRHGG
jgi:hypothetical protein